MTLEHLGRLPTFHRRRWTRRIQASNRLTRNRVSILHLSRNKTQVHIQQVAINSIIPSTLNRVNNSLHCSQCRQALRLVEMLSSLPPDHTVLTQRLPFPMDNTCPLSRPQTGGVIAWTAGPVALEQ